MGGVMMSLLLKLFGSKIGIAVLVAIAAGGTGWLYFKGQSSGFLRGYNKAEEAYIQQIEEAISTTVSRRDAQWTQDLENIYARINTTLEQNRQTIEAERNLRDRVEALQRRLIDVTSSLSDTDLGECNVTPEFDSLFQPYTEAPAEAGTP